MTNQKNLGVNIGYKDSMVTVSTDQEGKIQGSKRINDTVEISNEVFSPSNNK